MKRVGQSEKKDRSPMLDSLSVESIVNRHNASLDNSIDRLLELGMDLHDNQLPMIDIGPPKLVNKMKRGMLAEVNALTNFSVKEIERISKLFEAELEYLNVPTKKNASVLRTFTRERKWAQKRVLEIADEIRLSVSRNAYWANYFYGLPPILLSPRKQQTDRLEWEDEQFHNMGGGRHKLKKTKKSVLENGQRKNVLILTFPKVGTTTPRKKMEEQLTVTRNNRKIHILDFPEVHFGNTLLPRTPPFPAMKFFGYGKIVFVENVPDQCEIIFKQIQRVRFYYWTRKKGWRAVPKSQNTDGRPAKDEPGGLGQFPKKKLPSGEWLTADLPSFGMGLGRCPVVFQEKKFRMWVIEKCGDQQTILGYIEWGFNMLLHSTGRGNFTKIPRTEGTGIPEPPHGGWPNDLNSPDPVSWHDPDPNSPAGSEFNELYPDSGL